MTPHLPETTPDNTPLRTLLDANLRLPPEYRDQLTSHLPMALHALHSLGASGPRLQDFFARYATRFEEAGAPAPQPVALQAPADWRALRGQEGAYPELLRHFNDAIAREGAHGALREALPDLMPGVCAAAFHGVIRTAHAVQAGHAGELAAALAYWAWRWQTLDAPPTGGPVLAINAWAARLVQESIEWRSNRPLISLRMADASRTLVYTALAGALAPAPSLQARIAELAQLAVERYVANPNFTVLHMVTGLRALRELLPWLQDSESTQTLLARSVVAAYMAAQVEPLAAVPEAPAPSWDAVIAAAIASDDDHVIKLVHACREEAALYGTGHYLRAAALATASAG